jgi:hypothetical protein
LPSIAISSQASYEIGCSDEAVPQFPIVVAGLVPAIHAFFPKKKDVDGRDKRGHDVGRLCKARQ